MYTIDRTSYRSPNHSARPIGAPIDMIVLHSGEGTKASDLARLCNTTVPPARRVSAHYYVDRLGNIYELVDTALEAWHAGVSSWEGRTNINQYSVGIETEHKSGQDWPQAQCAALAWLCGVLIIEYTIKPSMIVAHRWIAPHRKSDPTDWSNTDLHTWIAALYAPPPVRFVRVLGATVYQDSLCKTPVTHLPADSVIRTDAAYPEPGYAPGVIHVVWDGGSGFLRGDSVEAVGS